MMSMPPIPDDITFVDVILGSFVFSLFILMIGLFMMALGSIIGGDFSPVDNEDEK